MRGTQRLEFLLCPTLFAVPGNALQSA